MPVVPPIQPRVVGPYPNGVRGSPVICHWGQLGCIQIFWAITGGPWYMGYRTLIVAPEPSVDRVVGASLSMGGRIGTHMLLWVPPRDLVVSPWG
jgi:hypothetical protein